MSIQRFTCQNCGNSFERNLSSFHAEKRKYCSLKCAGEAFKKLPDFEMVMREKLTCRSKLLPSGCIVYTGAHRVYGHIQYMRKTYLAHRASYIIHKGPIPKGMFVCHSCDNTLCINPDHLWLGTPKDNTQDMVQKNRKAPSHWKKLPDETFSSLLFDLSGHKLSQAQIARKYGVTDTYVSQIKKGYRRVEHRAGSAKT